MKKQAFGFVLCLLVSSSALSFDMTTFWNNLWHTKDQQGMQLMEKKAYEAAAHTFEDPEWKAAAAYRQGDYKQAEQLYRQKNDDTGFYNLGNALAKQQQYEQAVIAYEQALQRNPHHNDAKYNKQLIEELLKKQPKPEPKPEPSPKETGSPEEKSEEKSEKNPATPSEKKSSSEQTPTEKKQASADQSPQEQTPSESQKTVSNPDNTQKEKEQSNAQWLNLVPDHPGGLLRQQFLRDHQRRQIIGEHP